MRPPSGSRDSLFLPHVDRPAFPAAPSSVWSMVTVSIHGDNLMAKNNMLSYKDTNLSARLARRVRNACVQHFGLRTEDIRLTFHDNTVDSKKGPVRAKHGHDSLCEWHLMAFPDRDRSATIPCFLNCIPSESLPGGVEIQPIDGNGSYRIIATN